MLTSIITCAVFMRLNSFFLMVLTVFFSVSLEGLTFLFHPSLNQVFYGEPIIYTIACLYGLFIVQQRLDTFVRRNYLMKRVVVQHSFEIQDLEAKSKRFLRNLMPAPVVET